MGNRKIVVPEGMLKAAYDAQLPADKPTFSWEESEPIFRKFYVRVLTAALQWLAENPIVPTDKQVVNLQKLWEFRHPGEFITYEEATKNIAVEWQRRMFLAPEEDDSPISDLLEPPKPPFPEGKYRCYDDADVTRRVREAYRRGKKGK